MKTGWTGFSFGTALDADIDRVKSTICVEQDDAVSCTEVPCPPQTGDCASQGDQVEWVIRMQLGDPMAVGEELHVTPSDLVFTAVREQLGLSTNQHVQLIYGGVDLDDDGGTFEVGKPRLLNVLPLNTIMLSGTLDEILTFVCPAPLLRLL